MRRILIIFFMFIAMSVWLHYSVKDQVVGDIEYWQVIFVPDNRNKNNCLLPEFNETIKVIFGDIEEAGVSGQYRPLVQKIVIEDYDMNTVSHEAYHAVMHMLSKHRLYSDEEYGAYMLGSLVDCIVDIRDN